MESTEVQGAARRTGGINVSSGLVRNSAGLSRVGAPGHAREPNLEDQPRPELCGLGSSRCQVTSFFVAERGSKHRGYINNSDQQRLLATTSGRFYRKESEISMEGEECHWTLCHRTYYTVCTGHTCLLLRFISISASKAHATGTRKGAKHRSRVYIHRRDQPDQKLPRPSSLFRCTACQSPSALHVRCVTNQSLLAHRHLRCQKGHTNPFKIQLCAWFCRLRHVSRSSSSPRITAVTATLTSSSHSHTPTHSSRLYSPTHSAQPSPTRPPPPRPPRPTTDWAAESSASSRYPE